MLASPTGKQAVLTGDTTLFFKTMNEALHSGFVRETITLEAAFALHAPDAIVASTIALDHVRPLCRARGLPLVLLELQVITPLCCATEPPPYRPL